MTITNGANANAHLLRLIKYTNLLIVKDHIRKKYENEKGLFGTLDGENFMDVLVTSHWISQGLHELLEVISHQEGVKAWYRVLFGIVPHEIELRE